jgi:hypothetical protein
MTPSQKRFTVFVVASTLAFLSLLIYETITGSFKWWETLIAIVGIGLGGLFKYAGWMMTLGERDRKKAAKESGQIPA